MKTKGLLFILLLNISLLWSATNDRLQLRWDWMEGQSLNLQKSGLVRIYVNRQLSESRDEYNLANLVVLNKKNKGTVLEGHFKSLQKNRVSSAYRLLFETDSQFSMSPQGVHFDNSNSYQPSIRSLPSFPDHEIGLGDLWTRPAELVYQEFNPSFLISVDVQYQYMSITNRNDSELAIIHYRFQMDEKPAVNFGVAEENFPYQILGEQSGILLWDIKKNLPDSQKEIHKETLILNNGQRLDFQMEFTSRFDITREIAQQDLSQLKESIDNAHSNTAVETEVREDGLHITLKDILFAFNSDNLNESILPYLSSVAEQLADYPQYEIRIVGHTDNVGSEEFNMDLSTRRAKTVFLALQQSGLKSHPKMYYLGKGESEARADNETETGRAQNRRVEIILKQSGYTGDSDD